MSKTILRNGLVARAEAAASASGPQIEPFFRETAKAVLIAFARNPNLKEHELLRLLERKDLPQEVLQEIAAHPEAARIYAVKVALVRHPRTPRLVSLPLLKFLYLSDLMRVCHTPGVPADVKLVAEQTLLKRMESIPKGEQITLARQCPSRVAARLFTNPDYELIRAALDNPYLSEADLLHELAREGFPAKSVEWIAQHEKWSCRYHLRLALVRNPSTPLPRVLAFLPDLAVNDLREICLDRRMPEQVRNYVLAHCYERLKKKPAAHLPPKES
jgi:hypothetical protein